MTVHRNKFIYNKTKRGTYFPNLFWLKNEPLHVSGSSSAHHQESINRTLGTGMSYCLKTFSEQGRDGTHDDGQSSCPKHAEVHFLAKINLVN